MEKLNFPKSLIGSLVVFSDVPKRFKDCNTKILAFKMLDNPCRFEVCRDTSQNIPSVEIANAQIMLNQNLSTAIALGFCDISANFQAYLKGTYLFAEDSSSLETLFLAGARNERLSKLEQSVLKDETYDNCHDSAKNLALVDMIIQTLNGGQEDGWQNFVASNSFTTHKSNTYFYGWAERLFVNTICNAKHRVLTNA